MPYIDFADLKSRVSIMQVPQMLNLRLKQSGNQHRGPCPICNTGGDRALVITPERGLFYCLAGKTGGDLIQLVVHIKGCSPNQAAKFIRSQMGGPAHGRKDRATTPDYSAAHRGPRVGLNPLPYLEPEHPAVQALGISPETARAFESGYAGKGVLRGRYAVPIHGEDGALLAYVGIAVSKDQVPRLSFHNFDPASTIFNAHRLAAGGEVFVCGDPLQALKAVENGIELENVIAFLCDQISAKQFKMLAALMENKKTESAHLS